jgi:hypothetical protein
MAYPAVVAKQSGGKKSLIDAPCRRKPGMPKTEIKILLIKIISTTSQVDAYSPSSKTRCEKDVGHGVNDDK